MTPRMRVNEAGEVFGPHDERVDRAKRGDRS